MKGQYITEVLHVGNNPALCFSLVFPSDSYVLEPHLLKFGELAKELFVLPLVHEYERAVAAIAYIAKAEEIILRCFGPGLRMSTRSRPESWKGWNSSQSNGGDKGISWF